MDNKNINKETVDNGHITDVEECEQTLEHNFMWENLLPGTCYCFSYPIIIADIVYNLFVILPINSTNDDHKVHNLEHQYLVWSL